MSDIYRPPSLSDESVGYTPPRSAAELLERYGRDEHTLPFANLSRTVLSHVNLADVDLTGAQLDETDLGHATLRGAILLDADLSGSNLSFTDLRGADLRGANLDNAELHGADLDGARLEGASCFHTVLGSTRLGGIDLSKTDLAWVRCMGPSVLDLDALQLTARGLAEQSADPASTALFLQRCGVPRSAIDLFSSWVLERATFPACYIAHSHQDQPFALRLYEALQERRILCWPMDRERLDTEEQHLRPGHGPARWRRVVLCCSAQSMDSWWLEADAGLAEQKDRWLEVEHPEVARPCMIAVDLDGTLPQRISPLADRLRLYPPISFIGWENDDALFDQGLEQLLRVLRGI